MKNIWSLQLASVDNSYYDLFEQHQNERRNRYRSAASRTRNECLLYMGNWVSFLPFWDYSIFHKYSPQARVKWVTFMVSRLFIKQIKEECHASMGNFQI